MINSRKTSNALSGKTMRACDGCLGKRARWFCAADDAFLCQGCDASVHSANNLASRHERVRLQSSTSSPPSKIVTTSNDERSPPAWHRGFTRKARTPRLQNSNNYKPNSRKLLVQDSDVQERMFINNPLALVPEIGCEDDGSYMMGEFESEEQMICRVPVFDPFSNEDESSPSPRVVDVNYGEELLGTCDDELDLDVLPAGFLPSDVDLAEFAADVENLLGLDQEEDYFNSDGVIPEMVCGDGVRVKDEVQEIAYEGFDEMSRSGSLILDWNLEVDGAVKEEGVKGSSVSLTLNYDAVISAWDNQGSSPWTTGSRPDINPHYWSHCSLGTFPKDGAPYGGGLGQVGGKGDGEREARVLRYKEKRRTRLFSKKIRYEVRKLNAEKRPRMKGRFVKRTPSSFQLGTSSFPNYLTTK